MDIRITPGQLGGSIRAISSKSDAHRLLICAALADHETRIAGIDWSEDMEATTRCLSALGAQITREENRISVIPIRREADTEKSGLYPEKQPLLDCGESGSTLRFLLPVAAAFSGGTFVGKGRLPERPQGPLLHLLAEQGVRVNGERLPLSLTGGLRSGRFILPGDISSQYISGLLFALPLLQGDSEIFLTTALQSAGYVEMTLCALRRFGIEVEQRATGYFVKGGQIYHSPGSVQAEGDWSNAAFFLAAGVEVTGLNRSSAQGDKVIEQLLPCLGEGAVVNVSQIPDLLPILAVAAALSVGKTRFIGAARLRLKESDRIATTAALLRRLGGRVEEGDDFLAVTGTPLTGGEVEGANDHRIVMAAAIAATRASDTVIIRGADAVNKSYPHFFEDFKSLGGNCCVI